MDRILEVKNLRISFRTNNGTVKAVRDISFDLNKGETLAIVGESGSGKSVTARAVLGILAGNSIVENGEIIYDGRDLLKISEDEFHTLRGNRISMIFQDPLSSLNPIIKVGKQLTEAMILTNKERRRVSKASLNELLTLLEKNIIEAKGTTEAAEETKKKIAVFRTFVQKGIDLESAYDTAYENAKEALSTINEVETDVLTKSPDDEKEKLSELVVCARKSYNEYLVLHNDPRMEDALQRFEPVVKAYYATKDYVEVIKILNEIKDVLHEGMAKEKPNFFRLGYYLVHCNNPISGTVEELNKAGRELMDKEFMLDFINDVAMGLKYSHDQALEKKKDTCALLEKSLPVFEKTQLDRGECQKTANELANAVEHSIDRLEIVKHSSAYIFRTSINTAIKAYFDGQKNNPKELRRYESQKAKYDAGIKAGKDMPKAVPATLIDVENAQENMKKAVRNLIENYKVLLSEQPNYNDKAVAMIDHLKDLSSMCASKLTEEAAKHRAMELMSEVGIPEARRRFNQYPFEFSGGMRQRIVIAIALSANPDILICDEPTTALDVTIQAQILELINRLKTERKLSIIFITHDLGVVANMADRVAVMYAGKIVEYGTSDDVFYAPAHPYTWALLSSMPDLDTTEKLEAIPGTPPNMILPPVGDAFAARNKYAMQIDYEQQPPLFKINDTHYAATWLLHPNAPKVEPPAIVTERIKRMKRLEAEAHE